MKYIVRYGYMLLHGVFSFADAETFGQGSRVIVHTPRGQETGTVLCEAKPESLEKLKSDLVEGKIVRRMTNNDEQENIKIRELEQEEFRRCKAIIESMQIEMNLVRVEHIFSGERLIMYYTAEGRVDFRELVKSLAGEFRTRIEMRQIGVRDETKLLADYGDCGREVCCKSFLIDIPPVSMKMAKLQKATLDPYKISGRCGRLKCCLRNEYELYAKKEDEAEKQ
ncbi:signal peptidase [Planctomycetales bacterium]|nr:signal peptidase [Planctomycetales bacterium]